MRRRKMNKLRRLIREEVKLITEAGSYNHSSRLKPVKNISTQDIKTGDFIKFEYPSYYGDDLEERQLLVLDPGDENGNVRGVDISYTSERVIASIFANLADRMSPMAERMLSKNFPNEYVAGPIPGGHDEFYYDVIKKIPSAKDAYRAFKKSRMGEYSLITRMKYKPTLDGDLRDYIALR